MKNVTCEDALDRAVAACTTAQSFLDQMREDAGINTPGLNRTEKIQVAQGYAMLANGWAAVAIMGGAMCALEISTEDGVEDEELDREAAS